MTLIEFKGGPQGDYRVFICPDMVVSVSEIVNTQDAVNITLENAIVQVVQGTIDSVVSQLTKTGNGQSSPLPKE